MTKRQQRQKVSNDTYGKYRQITFKALRERGCSLCPEDNWSCLDFHHLGEKEKNIGNMHIYNVTKLADEVAKCVVVCANCHRKIHAGVIPTPTCTLERDWALQVIWDNYCKARTETKERLDALPR